MKPSSIRSRHPHPAMKWTLLVGFVAVLVLGAPSKVAASMPSVKAPAGPSNGGYFTGTYTFETYISCQSGPSFQSSYSNSLEGTHTFNFDGASDGSLLVRIDGGGDLILYSCGDPTPSALIVSYAVSRDTTSPSIGITSPADGSSTAASQIDVAVAAGDSTSGIGSVTVNGQASSFSGGSWHATVGLSVGSNILKAIATDRAGNNASNQITVTRQPSSAPSPAPPPPASGGGQPAPSSSGGTASAPATYAPAPTPDAPAPIDQPVASSAPVASPAPIPAPAVRPVVSPPKGVTMHHPLAWKIWLQSLLILALIALTGSLLARTSTRHLIIAQAQIIKIRVRPYLFRLKMLLRGREHDQPRSTHFAPRHHTGKVVAHHHTSYPALVFLLLCTALVSGAVSWSGRAASSESTLSLTVLGPAPTNAAYISVPLDGDTETSQTIQVKGTCPVGLVVEIYRDGGFAGSGYCDANGLFTVSITLYAGTNTLIARDVDGLGQYGPDSNAVTVTYSAPPPPTPSPVASPTPTPSTAPSIAAPSATPVPQRGKRPTAKPGLATPFTLDTDQHYFQGISPDQRIMWQLKLIAGTPPFTVTWSWGDGSRDIVSVTDRLTTSPAHAYHDPGFYKVTVTAQDGAGHSAMLQMLVVVNGASVPGATKSTPDFGRLQPIWPLLAGMLLLVTCFWLGERTFRDQHPALQPQT